MKGPFELLGVPPRFALDLSELERRHRELSRALHPDRHAGEAGAVRRAALGTAIEVNQAFRLLRDPVSRAEVLLARAGVACGEGKEPPASPELLLDVMEQREALAEARAACEPSRVRELAARMRAREQRLIRELGEALDALAPGSEELVQAEPARRALGLLGELRYVRRFLEEVDRVLDDLDG